MSTTGRLRRSRILAIVTMVVIVGSYALLAAQVHALAGYQHAVRLAQLARTATLRAQLDLENGLRGYVSTGDRSMLGPYAVERPEIRSRFRTLLDRLADVGVDPLVQSLAADEAQTTAAWLQEVAEPVLREPHGAGAVLTLERGSKLTDRFRGDNERIASALSVLAEDADAAGQRFVYTVAGTGGVVFVLLSLLLLSTYRDERRLRERIETTKTAYESEKRVAETLAQAFAQRTLPQTTTVGIHAAYVPAEEQARVGGDWYDAFALPDGRILVTIGDVTGHGLSAAVAMSRARQTLIGAALAASDPAEVLARANAQLLLQDERVVTALCGFVDPARRSFSYASAGHPPPVLARAGGESAVLPYGGLPLGVDAGATYETRTIGGLDDALVVLYTDGLLEHKRDAVDGEERIVAAARRAHGSLGDAAGLVHASVLEGDGSPDDVAILTIRFPRASEGDAVRMDSLQSSQLDAEGLAVVPAATRA